MPVYSVFAMEQQRVTNGLSGRSGSSSSNCVENELDGNYFMKGCVLQKILTLDTEVECFYKGQE